MDNIIINSDEQLDDLQLNNLKILQKDGCFRYGTDAIALSNFASKYIKKDASVLDIGTGTGIIPILLSAKTNAKSITGLEIQEEMVELANKSIKINEQSGALAENRIKIINADIMNVKNIFPTRSFNAIVTNPPYKRRGSGILNDSNRLNIARHEIYCTLADIIEKSAYLLKKGGDFIMVNHPERLADSIEAMRKYKIEPKELQFVYSDINSKPILFLVHGVLFGGKNLIIEKGIEVK